MAKRLASGHAAVFLLLHRDTTGCSAVQLDYRLRDLDTDTAVLPHLVQSRLGATADFAEVPGTYVADANIGGDLTFSVQAQCAQADPIFRSGFEP